MTIKQQGGIFGRNPSLNDVDVNTLDVSGVSTFGAKATIESSWPRLTHRKTTDTSLLETGIDASGAYIKGTYVSGGTADVRFIWASSEKMRITNNGITFNGDTAAANALDDYEEGTWTPSLIGATSGSMSFAVTALNRYTKVGSVVHAVAFLTSGDMGAHTISGNVLVSGLPFTATAVGAGVVSVTYCNLTTADEADLTISGYANGTNILLLKGSSTSAVTSADLVASGTNGAIMLDITYETGA